MFETVLPETVFGPFPKTLFLETPATRLFLPLAGFLARAVFLVRLMGWDGHPGCKPQVLPNNGSWDTRPFRHFFRGLAARLFISRETCSDSIAKIFRACFCGGIAQLSRDTLQNGVSHRCACVKLRTKGVSHHFGGVLTSLKKYRAIWGIAAIVSQHRAIPWRP